MKIPPALLMLLSGAAIWLLGRHLPLLSFEFPYQRPLSSLAFLVGAYLVGSGVARFIKAGTTVDPLHPDQSSELVTEGLYRYTRNPMYLGFALMLCGIAVRIGALSGILIVPLFVWWITALQIRPEEQALEAKFGESFVRYKQQTRRWL